MELVALLMILAGAYIIDSVGKNRAPVATLKTMISNPDKISDTWQASKGTGGTLPSGQTATNGGGGGGGGGETVPIPTSGGRVEPNAKGFTGVNAAFLTRVQAWAATGSTVYRVTGNGGFRERADQQRAYDLFRSGKGPLAAVPGTSAHERGDALDVNPWPDPLAVSRMGQFGIGLTVKGEPWHIGNKG